MTQTSHPHCYLPIEVLARELDAKIHLATRLNKQGFPCIIGKKSQVIDHMLKGKKPYIYFDKGMAPLHTFYNEIKQTCGIMVELQEEGTVSRNSDRLLMSHTDDLLEYPSAVFVWGAYQQKTILAHTSRIQKHAIPITGHPSFDLCMYKYKDYYRELGIKHCKTANGCILINTNFNRYNGMLNFEQSKAYNPSTGHQHYTPEKQKEWQAMASYQKQLLQEFLVLAEELALRHPTTNIVIRPHPVEKIAIYQDLSKKYDNLHVLKVGSVREWIAYASLVIHHDCTTGIEAFMMNTPVISYCPAHEPAFTAQHAIMASNRRDDLQSVLNDAESVLSGRSNLSSNTRNEKEAFLQEFFNNFDAGAADRIANHISEHIPQWLQSCPMKPTFGPKQSLIHRISAYVLTKLTSLLGTTPVQNQTKNLRQDKFPGVELNHIQQRVDLFQKLDKDLPPIMIDELAPNLFRLQQSVSTNNASR